MHCFDLANNYCWQKLSLVTKNLVRADFGHDQVWFKRNLVTSQLPSPVL